MKRVFDSIELVPTMEAEASRYSTLLIPWIQNYALIDSSHSTNSYFPLKHRSAILMVKNQ